MVSDTNAFGLEGKASRSAYQLTICTANKYIYQVNFDRHYLRKGETITVDKLDTENTLMD